MVAEHLLIISFTPSIGAIAGLSHDALAILGTLKQVLTTQQI